MTESLGELLYAMNTCGDDFQKKIVADGIHDERKQMFQFLQFVWDQAQISEKRKEKMRQFMTTTPRSDNVHLFHPETRSP